MVPVSFSRAMVMLVSMADTSSSISAIVPGTKV